MTEWLSLAFTGVSVVSFLVGNFVKAIVGRATSQEDLKHLAQSLKEIAEDNREQMSLMDKRVRYLEENLWRPGPGRR